MGWWWVRSGGSGTDQALRLVETLHSWLLPTNNTRQPSHRYLTNKNLSYKLSVRKDLALTIDSFYIKPEKCYHFFVVRG